MSTETTQAIESYTISISDEALDDLRHRLARTRFAQELADVGDAYGVPGDYVREMTSYWLHEYDWRAWERRINAFPQFRTEIDGQPLHFFHVRSPEPSAISLVLLHGWPGSFLEFITMMGPLTDPAAHGGDPADAFHLVIPSYPGFGFSGPTVERGWTTSRTAQAIAELMSRLGYERFGAQGGDTGAIVGPALGRIAPERLIGVHVSAATWGFIPFSDLEPHEIESLSDGERKRLDRMQRYVAEQSGYFHIQSTRPQTVAYGLADSPVGQLAWIGDWFYHGRVDRELVLTNIMIYWLTNTSASSARIYYEDMHAGEWPEPSSVPTGVANFAEDVAIRRYAEQANNIVHWSEFDAGGHFAAFEVPDLLVNDIRTFFRSLR